MDYRRPIVAVGDPHGLWQPLKEACRRINPAAAILLGDCDLERPLREELAEVFDAGIQVYWIHGNHDADEVRYYDFLHKSHPEGCLHGRVAEIEGLRVGGIGGVFRGKIWYPKEGHEQPRIPSPEEFLRAYCRQGSTFRGGVPLKHRGTIFPSDFEALKAHGKLDILVTHEAPSCHDNGFRALDDLAKSMDASLIIHGHHHYSYERILTFGTRVRGLGRAEVWEVKV